MTAIAKQDHRTETKGLRCQAANVTCHPVGLVELGSLGPENMKLLLYRSFQDHAGPEVI
jgi:hypothetical protein